MQLKDMIGKTRTDSNGTNVNGFTVLQHSILVGAASIALSRHYPILKEDGVAYYFSLHDVGKVTPGFQTMISCAVSPGGISRFPGTEGTSFSELVEPSFPLCRHHEEGAEYHFSREGGGAVRMNPEMRNILRVHHGTIRNKTTPLTPDSMGDGEWVRLRDELCEELSKVFGNNTPNLKYIKKNKDLLKGLLCLSDWIGSDEEVFETDPQHPDYPFKEGWVLSDLVETAYKGIQERGLGARIEMDKGKTFQDLFWGWSPKPIQKALIDAVNGPGVYILEAPMGLGKTEAALYAAYKCIDKGLASGFYFGLPTQVTSNKIHQRINFVQAGLLHGGSKLYLQSRGRPSSNHKWFNNSKRSILLPAGVGTVDQALMSVLPKKKHYYLRSLGIHNKVMILDEVHSYDAYTGKLIQRLVSNGHIVILLSATLTAKAKAKLLGVEDTPVLARPEYPLVTSYHKDTGEIETFSHGEKIKDLDYSIDCSKSRGECLEEALQKAREGYKVLWFENIVDEALEVYQKIPNDIPKGILHSRFCKEDRDVNEDLWISKYGKGSSTGEGSILVSTQVAEQSLDIDADVMYTALCPSDMLLQRMGRVWRHERPRPQGCIKPMIRIHHGPMTPDAKNIHEFCKEYGSKTPYVYEPFILHKTLETFSNINHLPIPSGIRGVMEDTYNGSCPDPWKTWKSDMINKALSMETLASTSAASSQEGPTEEDAEPSNIDDGTVSTRMSDGQETVEAVLVDDHNGNSVSIDGKTWDLKDFKSALTLDKRKIKVNPGKLGENVLREVKPKRFPMFLLVQNDMGVVLDTEGRASGTLYKKELGMIYPNKKRKNP